MEKLIVLLESTANMMRGMTLDPAIPLHAKNALWCRITEIEIAIATVDDVVCDACGKQISPDQKNVGHECDLHEECVDNYRKQ